MKKFDSEHIILNRFRANTYYLAKDGIIKEIPSYFKNPYQAHDKYNIPLRKLEDYIIEKYHPYVIDLSKYFMGDENVWSNLQGAHFENEFYHETFQSIQYIMKEKPKQKVWARPDFFTNKKVQAEGALDIEDAFIKFEQLIEKEDILWMNIFR